MKNELKKFPLLHSDEEAEEFLANADLSEYDFSGFRPMHYEFKKKDSALNMKLPASLAEAGKVKARKLNMPFSRYMRMLLETDLQRDEQQTA